MNKPPAVYPVERVLNVQATLGEGPLWDYRQQVLWWVDIEEHQLYRFNPSTGENVGYDVGQRIGTVVTREKGGLMLALQAGFAQFDPQSGQIDMIASPEADKPTNRFNEGKCDPGGRFWAGTMEIAEQDMSAGALYCLYPDGRVDKKLDGVGISNGIVWTSDRRRMYYIDSPTRRVDVFDYDHATGGIENRRCAIQIPPGMGHPDGMTIDHEDNLWVALWGGWGVACFDPRRGDLIARVEMPVEQVTACAFGGPDLDRLFITTARKGLDSERLRDQPDAGAVFVASVPVRGVAAAAFSG